MNNVIIKELLDSGKAVKHGTHDKTGIVVVSVKRISGTAGTDVNCAYISPNEVDIVTNSNVHYGYGHLSDKGTIVDNSGRSEFEIV